MSAPLAVVARTFVIGIAVAAPVGAMGVLCMQRTLERGWRSGMATGLGIATADGIYAGLAAFGVAAVSSAFVAWQTPLRLLGGAVLLYLGIRTMMRSRDSDCDRVPVVSPSGSHYVAALGLTLTNPMTIMAFGAVFAGAGLSAAPSAGVAVLATAGVAFGSLTWWLLLVTLVTLVRHRVGDALTVGVSRVSGVVIAAFGIAAMLSVVI